jgi:hypothetical protein
MTIPRITVEQAFRKQLRQQGRLGPDAVSELPAEMAFRFTEFEGGFIELVRVGDDGDHKVQQQTVHGGVMRPSQQNGDGLVHTLHFSQDALPSQHGAGEGLLRFGQ